MHGLISSRIEEHLKRRDHGGPTSCDDFSFRREFILRQGSLRSRFWALDDVVQSFQQPRSYCNFRAIPRGVKPSSSGCLLRSVQSRSGEVLGTESCKGDPRTRFVLLGVLKLCAGWHILRHVRHIEEDDELSAWLARERATVLLHGLFADRAQRCHWVTWERLRQPTLPRRQHVSYCSVRVTDSTS
jgi:hypothetical protein